MEKPPYFPFYVNDFVSDGNVEAMTTEEVGAYTLLLCKAWAEDPAGSIPDDDLILARWARLSRPRWLKARPAVLKPFSVGKDGRLHQKRMKAEYGRAIDKIKARSKAGRDGANKRWQTHDSVNGEPLRQQTHARSVCVSGSDSCSQDGGPGEGFERFWNAFPRKASFTEAIAAWIELNPDADCIAAILEAIEKQKQSDQWRRNVIPNPDQWLRKRRWLDQLPETRSSAKETTEEKLRRLLPDDPPTESNS